MPRPLGVLILLFIIEIKFEEPVKKMLEESSNGVKCKIEHSYSHTWAGLQFADLLAWCCFQKFENKDPSYLEKLNIEQEFYTIWQ